MTIMRVALVVGAVARPPGGVVLGDGPGGTWIECDDEAVIARAGQLELLWLSRAAYDRAVRQLEPDEVARVIALRRVAFASQLPARAKAELFAFRLRALAAAAREQASEAFARSLDVLARLAGPGRFKGIGDAGLLERLVTREQALCNELDSPEGQPEAIAGELDARRALRDVTVQSLAAAGRPEYAAAPLHVALVRDYLLRPAPAALLADWQRNGTPAVAWQGGAIGPATADQIAALAPSLSTATLMFPLEHQATGLRMSLTAAQLAVELAAREIDPQMTAHVAGLRVELATFRRNALALTTDASIAAALADQIVRETPLVMAALAARPAFVDAGPPLSRVDAEARFRATAALLSTLVARHGAACHPLAVELATFTQEP